MSGHTHGDEHLKEQNEDVLVEGLKCHLLSSKNAQNSSSKNGHAQEAWECLLRLKAHHEEQDRVTKITIAGLEQALDTAQLGKPQKRRTSDDSEYLRDLFKFVQGKLRVPVTRGSTPNKPTGSASIEEIIGNEFDNADPQREQELNDEFLRYFGRPPADARG